MARNTREETAVAKKEAEAPTRGFVKRKHPLYPIWTHAELKQRASFTATKEELIPFLVPHRFEVDEEA